MGRFEEAKNALAAARRIYSTILGEDHPWTTITDGNAIHVLVDSGDWTEAEDAVNRYLTAARGFWPEDHLRVAAFESIRGACRMAQRDYGTAEEILGDSLQRLESGLGHEHALTRLAIERLGELYERTGRAAAANELEARSTSAATMAVGDGL